MKHVRDALRINRVSRYGSPRFYSSHSNPSQTLITLDLDGNSIGDKGAKHVRDAIKINQVSERLTPLHHIGIHQRHSPHSTLMEIVLGLKERNMLLMD